MIPNPITEHDNGVVEIDISTEKHTNCVCAVDQSDYQYLNECHDGRIFARKINGDICPSIILEGKIVALVRFLMDVPAGKIVMHRDHNKLNCRRSNTVVCTRLDIPKYRRQPAKHEAKKAASV